MCGGMGVGWTGWTLQWGACSSLFRCRRTQSTERNAFLQTWCEPQLIPNGATRMHGNSALREKMESQVSKKKAVGAKPSLWHGAWRRGSTGTVPRPARPGNAGGGFPRCLPGWISPKTAQTAWCSTAGLVLKKSTTS